MGSGEADGKQNLRGSRASGLQRKRWPGREGCADRPKGGSKPGCEGKGAGGTRGDTQVPGPRPGGCGMYFTADLETEDLGAGWK